jgi:NhaA family Na+:H+ antiporter
VTEQKPKITERWRNAGPDFVRSEVAGGAVLLLAAVAAVVWANLSVFGDSYTAFWSRELTLGVPGFSKTEDLQYWVNDLLMVFFFFIVGLEIKRELAAGELNDRSKAKMPLIAALGGVFLPGVIFLSLNLGGEGAAGWAIPMATDIAFAVGVLALLGSRIPAGIRLLLLSIAIVDDVIAILIIAVFYSEGLSLVWIALSLVAFAVVLLMQRGGVAKVWPYWVIGAVVWVAVLSSGVHATIAGVILGLMTPAQPVKGRHVLEDLEHGLHPWTSLLIVPVFALANAGIVISGETVSIAIGSSIFWGIGLGLILGKLFGISGAILLARRFGWGQVPAGVTTGHIWGIGALGGIGFTVSLFITSLAFTEIELIDDAKMGIFAGSIISALVGVVILLWKTHPTGKRSRTPRPAQISSEE